MGSIFPLGDKLESTCATYRLSYLYLFLSLSLAPLPFPTHSLFPFFFLFHNDSAPLYFLHFIPLYFSLSLSFLLTLGLPPLPPLVPSILLSLSAYISQFFLPSIYSYLSPFSISLSLPLFSIILSLSLSPSFSTAVCKIGAMKK